MSHVVAGTLVFTDLECLKRALKKFPKLHWMEGQKKYAWYGKWVNDYSQADAAYKNGIDTEDYGKCEHAIRMDGAQYEIGVCKRKDGSGYSLVWDFYGSGKNISNYVGDGAEKLMVEYSQEYASEFSQNNGFMINKEEDEEFIYISMTQ